MKHEDVYGLVITRKTLDTLQADPAKYRTCSRPTRDNPGCMEWHNCTLAKKLKTDARGIGEGPCNVGVHLLKKDPTTKEMTLIPAALTCFHVWKSKRDLMLNGGNVRIVAQEGEEFEQIVTKPRDETIPGQGVVRFHDEVPSKEPIPEYRDPTDRKMLRAAIAKKMLEVTNAEDEGKEIAASVAAAAAPPRRR